MKLQVKICGLRDRPALEAALASGAAFIGLNFYAASPNFAERHIAAELAELVPQGVTKTGLFVDADNAQLRAILAEVPLDLIQLHGNETPDRVMQIKRLTGLPVMKALRLKSPEAFKTIPAYDAVADRLLFDSRNAGGPSGGALDWAALQNIQTTKPWMLAGGLTAENLAEAVKLSGATAVDVSSGVEESPGVKSPAKIGAFLAEAARL